MLFHHVKSLAVSRCARGWPHVFTICQAYLEHHPTLLLATLICRPHNDNAISRSPSGESVCAMHRDLPKQTPGACPAKAAEPFNTVTAKPEKSHAVFARPAAPLGHARGSSAWLLCKLSPGSKECQATPHWLGWARGVQSPCLATVTAGSYSGNVPHSGEQGKCLHYSAT